MPVGKPRGRSEKLRSIAEMLMANAGASYCDDCARKFANVTRAFAPEASLTNLAAERGFIRARSICSGCGQARVTTQVTYSGRKAPCL
jgi:hypothetical protein